MSHSASHSTSATESRPPFKPCIHPDSVIVNEFVGKPRRYDSNVFLGGACDTGAQKTVVRFIQAQSYCKTAQISSSSTSAKSVFIFGNMSCHSLPLLRFILSTSFGRQITPSHVVPICIPILIGLVTLDYHAWNVLMVQHCVKSVREKKPFLYIVLLVAFFYDGRQTIRSSTLRRN